MDDPFRQSRDPRMRADRYQRLARQYFELAKGVSSPSLRADYQRTAEEYRVRAQGELSLSAKALRPLRPAGLSAQ